MMALIAYSQWERQLFHVASQYYVLPSILAALAAYLGFWMLRVLGLPTLVAQVAAISVGVLVFSGFQQVYWEGWQYRFLMTVNVVTPDGLKSGSSVVEAGIWAPRLLKISGMNSGTGLTIVTRGGSVVVDLGRFGKLTGLVTARHPYRSVDSQWNKNRLPSDPYMRSTKTVLSVVLDPDDKYLLEKTPIWGFQFTKTKLTKVIPPLFWRPINGKREYWEPLFPREFETKIGRGVRLQSITIEPTSNPITPRAKDRRTGYWSTSEKRWR